MATDRDYLEITFNTIDEGITIYDQELRLVIWNDQYQKMGITPDEDLYRGASLLETYIKMAKRGVFGEGDPESLATEHINALLRGPLVESEYLRSPHKRLIRINRFRLENGGVCATFRDVTDEHEAEVQLRQAAKLDAIGKLTGGVAHDINNVLAVIIGSLEVAQVDPASAQAGIKAAIDAADRGAQLVRSLLAFARQQPLEPTVVNLSETLTEMRSFLPPLLGETIEVEMILDAGLWRVEIDINQFQAAILNFAVNARDAMPDGGQLTIEAGNSRADEEYAAVAGITPGQYVLVSLTDTGIGMTEEVMERAFDPFFTTKKAGIGTGLGLSMAHGFIRQSNGHIKLYSEPDCGTTIKLYLPRTHASPIVSGPHASTSIDFSELSVLVVEDDDKLRLSVCLQLRSLNCTVLSASNSKEALRLLDISRVDLLLTDVVMPGTGGIELARVARSKNPRIAVVFMSGYSQNSIIHHGRVDPGVVLLQKPFRRTDLISTFERAIRNAEDGADSSE